MSERVLVVAAHPDDEVLGMGATIALHAVVRRDAVRILCLTDGSSTQYPGDDAKRAQKADEAVRAAKELGVEDYVHLDLPDMRLDTIPHADLNAVVEAQVQDFGPSRVYCVHPDVNRDHQAAFASVAVATRPFPGQTVRRVLTYAPSSSIEWTPTLVGSFQPNCFFDVSETIDRKVAAFACYETEQRPHPHPRNELAIRATAQHYGLAAGCEWAEAFVLVRTVDP